MFGDSHDLEGDDWGHPRITAVLLFHKSMALLRGCGGYTAHHPRTFRDVQERPLLDQRVRSLDPGRDRPLRLSVFEALTVSRAVR
jgi:hypothetical protein